MKGREGLGWERNERVGKNGKGIKGWEGMGKKLEDGKGWKINERMGMDVKEMRGRKSMGKKRGWEWVRKE